MHANQWNVDGCFDFGCDSMSTQCWLRHPDYRRYSHIAIYLMWLVKGRVKHTVSKCIPLLCMLMLYMLFTMVLLSREEDTQAVNYFPQLRAAPHSHTSRDGVQIVGPEKVPSPCKYTSEFHLHRPAYLLKDFQLDTVSVENRVQKDLSLCSKILSRENHFSQAQDEVVQQSLAALQRFISPNHLPDFSNPCWYTDFNMPNKLNRSLEPRIVANLPKLEELYTRQEVLKVLEEIADRRNIHKVNTGHQQLFCMPSVFLAGFPKCGTTALYEMLTTHPAIAVPHSKEIHFWSVFSKTKDAIYKAFQSLHYLYHFLPAGRKILQNPEAITLDASPDTILDIATTTSQSLDSDMCIVPTIISRLLPKAKYIVLMRNPVDRLWSAYWYFCIEQQWKQKGHGVSIPETYMHHGPEAFHNHVVSLINQYLGCLNSNATEFECARRVPPSANSMCTCSAGRLDVGMYYLHIVKWLSIVPRDQFLFLRAEDLVSHPRDVLQKVWKFLALNPPSEDANLKVSYANTNTWIRRHKKFKMLPLTRQMLSSFYHSYNLRLSYLLKDDSFLWIDHL